MKIRTTLLILSLFTTGFSYASSLSYQGGEPANIKFTNNTAESLFVRFINTSTNTKCLTTSLNTWNTVPSNKTYTIQQDASMNSNAKCNYTMQVATDINGGNIITQENYSVKFTIDKSYQFAMYDYISDEDTPTPSICATNHECYEHLSNGIGSYGHHRDLNIQTFDDGETYSHLSVSNKSAVPIKVNYKHISGSTCNDAVGYGKISISNGDDTDYTVQPGQAILDGVHDSYSYSSGNPCTYEVQIKSDSGNLIGKYDVKVASTDVNDTGILSASSDPQGFNSRNDDTDLYINYQGQ